MNFTCNQLAKRHLECCSTAPSITSWQIFSELFGFSSAKNSKSHIMRKVLQGKNELHFFFQVFYHWIGQMDQNIVNVSQV